MTKRKTVIVNVRMTEAQRDAMHAEAERRGIKHTDYMRSVLTGDIERAKIMQQMAQNELPAYTLTEPAQEQRAPVSVTHIELIPATRGILVFSGMDKPEAERVMQIIRQWVDSGTSHLVLSLPDGAHLELQPVQTGPDMTVDWRDSLGDEWCKCTDPGEPMLKFDGEHELCAKCNKPVVCVWSLVSPYYDPQRLHAADEVYDGHALCHGHAQMLRKGPGGE